MVDVELVVLEVADRPGTVLLHLPHVLPQLLPALPHLPVRGDEDAGACAEDELPGHILGDVDVAPLQHGRLPQHLLPVAEVLEADHDRSTSGHVRPSLHPGSFGDDNVSPQGESLLQYRVDLNMIIKHISL